VIPELAGPHPNIQELAKNKVLVASLEFQVQEWEQRIIHILDLELPSV
jgi:hypothetical protein